MKKLIRVAILAGAAGGAMLVYTLAQGVLGHWHWPPFGGGGGPGGEGGKGPVVIASPDEPPTPAKPQPLEITVDDDKYLVKGVEVKGLDELLKMAAAVPQEVPPPRVRVVLRRTSRYIAETKLSEALQGAKIEFLLSEE